MRTRWAAIGAACAVALGAGGFGVVNAVVSSGEKSVFVPVSPIRVLDTRDGTEITNGTRRLVVEGAITVADGSSQLVVPSAASAVAVNITATSTRKNGGYGFVTVFPCVADSDAVPNASSLNFENGVDIANALSVSTSSNGSICLYVYGTADLIVDVAGYYVDHDHDDRYYTEAEMNVALNSKADVADVMAELADKADADDLLTKANAVDVTTALQGKADTSDLVRRPLNGGPFTVDGASSAVGAHSSIAIGVTGNPIISYYDQTNGDLKVASCIDSRCSSSTISTIDGGTSNVGSHTSIAIGFDGRPIIAYRDVTNADLKVAACNDAICSSATVRTVDGLFADVGSHTSVAITPNGNPVISYADITNGVVKLASCVNSTCSAANLSAVDYLGDFFTSITIGISGFPVISYFSASATDLKMASCPDLPCATPTTTIVDNLNVGYYTSIAIGTNGFPVISYFDIGNTSLKVAACGNATCSQSTLTTVDNAGSVGYDIAMIIGPNGNPIISYHDGDATSLKIAVCTTPTCSSSNIATVDNSADIGYESSLTMGVDGFPVVSYFDNTSGDLKVITPWWLVGGR